MASFAHHSNISVFVPHIGCKHQCSFCNQRYITGQTAAPDENDVDNAVNIAISSANYDKQNGQIAFFGGSFTAIKQDYMLRLLGAAKRRIDMGDAQSIRISTRPDAIDENILTLLREYGVQSIELGAQSMCDDVLRMNERGHMAADVTKAAELIKQGGFELGLQMMTGLYGDTYEKSVYTAEQFIELAPDTVRIYPTIVLENTRLCELYKAGAYQPQTVAQAASLGAKLLMMFYENEINVIRFGLHSIEQQHYVAGPWHPSIAELAYSAIYLKKAEEMLQNAQKGSYIIFVNQREISKMSGQHKCNLEKLREMGYNCRIRADESLDKYEVKIEREELT